MNQIEQKKDIGPIFIFAASWRTGSTLLQRVLNASNQIFIFGESGGEPSFISRFRALCENQKKYLEKVSWNREQTNLNKKGQWIPIFNPPLKIFINLQNIFLIIYIAYKVSI